MVRSASAVSPMTKQMSYTSERSQETGKETDKTKGTGISGSPDFLSTDKKSHKGQRKGGVLGNRANLIPRNLAD